MRVLYEPVGTHVMGTLEGYACTSQSHPGQFVYLFYLGTRCFGHLSQRVFKINFLKEPCNSPALSPPSLQMLVMVLSKRPANSGEWTQWVQSTPGGSWPGSGYGLVRGLPSCSTEGLLLGF
jgi:hypothetical protein